MPVVAAGEGGRCPPAAIVAADAVLIIVDGAIAAIAFFQLLRTHLRSQELGWTRKKVFHLMIGLCNLGWGCWTNGCGFILMACPQILFLATFLLLLSFWTDLCHQPNDDDEEDDDLSICESFLEKANAPPSRLHIHGRCFPFGKVRLGSRQKYVILVIVLTFAFMVAMAILIYVGRRKNPIESSLVAKALILVGAPLLFTPPILVEVYMDVFSVCIIILGLALALYGGILFSKMRKIRSEMASTEMLKVASLAAVSLVCFTSSSALALATNCPILSYEHLDCFDSINCSASEFFYYIVGFSVPSSYVLWSMREMPPGYAADLPPQTREVIIIRDSPPAPPIPQWRTTVTNSQNKVMKASPI